MYIGCGGLLKDPTGIISAQLEVSNGGLGSYNNCNWVIRAPQGSLIRIIWVTFQLKQRYICGREYLQVFDNNTITGRGGLVGKYCGNKLPPSFISTSNVVTLSLALERFSTTTSGFTLSYNFVQETKRELINPPLKIKIKLIIFAFVVCGGDFHSAGGVIRSPNYPGRVSLNVDCTWTITVQQDHQILLNVTSFHLENMNQCKYDFLEIRYDRKTSQRIFFI